MAGEMLIFANTQIEEYPDASVQTLSIQAVDVQTWRWQQSLLAAIHQICG